LRYDDVASVPLTLTSPLAGTIQMKCFLTTDPAGAGRMNTDKQKVGVKIVSKKDAPFGEADAYREPQRIHPCSSVVRIR